MEEYTRCQDTLKISYDSCDKYHNLYFTQKGVIEQTCKKIENELKLQGLLDNNTATCYFQMNRDKKESITFILYKREIFAGIFCANTRSICFETKFDERYLLGSEFSDSMTQRLVANIKTQHIERKDYVKEAWTEKLPLLDSIIDFKKEVNKLPENQRDIIYHSLQYDNTVNSLIESFENRDIKQDIERE